MIMYIHKYHRCYVYNLIPKYVQQNSVKYVILEDTTHHSQGLISVTCIACLTSIHLLISYAEH